MYWLREMRTSVHCGAIAMDKQAKKPSFANNVEHVCSFVHMNA